MWFQIEFPKLRTLTELQFKSPDIRQGNYRERLPSLKTYPRRLVIETSKDGKNWEEVFRGEGSTSPNVLRLETSEGKFLRMKQISDGDKKSPWSMLELKVFGLTEL